MGEGLPEQFDRQVEQTVRIHTDVRLEGARTGRVWPDEVAGGIPGACRAEPAGGGQPVAAGTGGDPNDH